jgi:hypothetical protein
MQPHETELLWLNIINISLGVVVFICAAVMISSIVAEVVARRRRRLAYTAEIERDAHAFFSPELGLTMADGGEPVEHPQKSSNPRKKR